MIRRDFVKAAAASISALFLPDVALPSVYEVDLTVTPSRADRVPLREFVEEDLLEILHLEGRKAVDEFTQCGARYLDDADRSEIIYWLAETMREVKERCSKAVEISVREVAPAQSESGCHQFFGVEWILRFDRPVRFRSTKHVQTTFSLVVGDTLKLNSHFRLGSCEHATG